MQRAVITDLDHTLTNAYWRDPLLGDWENYYREAINDQPIRPVIRALKAWRGRGFRIVCITGRPERWRALSVKWLHQYRVPVDEMLMRADDDHRPAVDVKLDLVRQRFPDLLQVAWVMEDRTDMCDAYRKIGLDVFQVHLGSKEE